MRSTQYTCSTDGFGHCFPGRVHHVRYRSVLRWKVLHLHDQLGIWALYDHHADFRRTSHLLALRCEEHPEPGTGVRSQGGDVEGLKIYWWLYNMTLSLALIISTVYWVFLHGKMSEYCRICVHYLYCFKWQWWVCKLLHTLRYLCAIERKRAYFISNLMNFPSLQTSQCDSLPSALSPTAWILWWCWSISWSLHFRLGYFTWCTEWVWRYSSFYSRWSTIYAGEQMSEYLKFYPYTLQFRANHLHNSPSDLAIITCIPFWIGTIPTAVWWPLWASSCSLCATGCCSLDSTSWRECSIGHSVWFGLLMLWVWYEGVNTTKSHWISPHGHPHVYHVLICIASIM